MWREVKDRLERPENVSDVLNTPNYSWRSRDTYDVRRIAANNDLGIIQDRDTDQTVVVGDSLVFSYEGLKAEVDTLGQEIDGITSGEKDLLKYTSENFSRNTSRKEMLGYAGTGVAALTAGYLLGD